MLTSLKLKMYQKLNDPTFLFTVLGFLLLAPVMLVAWLLSILFAPVKLLANGVSSLQSASDEDDDFQWNYGSMSGNFYQFPTDD